MNSFAPVVRVLIMSCVRGTSAMFKYFALTGESGTGWCRLGGHFIGQGHHLGLLEKFPVPTCTHDFTQVVRWLERRFSRSHDLFKVIGTHHKVRLLTDDSLPVVACQLTSAGKSFKKLINNIILSSFIGQKHFYGEKWASQTVTDVNHVLSSAS